MTKRVRELRDLVIDEISLVDKGANQHATVTIAKNYGEEETNMDLFDEAGEPVDPTSLTDGQVVFDADGQAYEFEAETEGDAELEEEQELESVGKSAYSTPFAARRAPVAKSLAASVREELSKALTDADRDEVISKALGQVDALTEIAKSAQLAAEAERVLRLEREYEEIAKSYNVPVAPDELGGVLMRAAEALSYEDCAVIAKCLDAAGEGLFEEYGHRGGGDNVDILSQVDSLVDSRVGKSAGTREDAITDVFAENPDAYAEYLATRQGY